jgi:hypothetical protein
MPRFLYGDRLRWIAHGETPDWGIAIGRFYSFAPHCRRWRWCYTPHDWEPYFLKRARSIADKHFLVFPKSPILSRVEYT